MPMLAKMRKTVVASGVVMALGTAPAVNAIQILPTNVLWDLLGVPTLAAFSSDSANMTMLNPFGNTVGGTNNVNMIWDGSVFTSSGDYTGPGSTSNITASSTTPFFGYSWTAHDIQAFAPGSYSFDATLGGGAAETGTVGGTVGLGQFGVHMLFDWNGNLNIDVFVVADLFSQFGSGIGRNTTGTYSGGNQCDGTGSPSLINCLYDGKDFGSAGKPTGDQTWMLASIDPDGDGIMGIPMAAGGPFAGFNANFNVNVVPEVNLPGVPIPAAAWLFGSGLLGLIGIGRRRKCS